ncbi:DEP domain-containing protein 1A [Aplysia californica]|uniref:DEP domain-containing protein 1A n=1 Tax=Aplysia californica TaxID=6500 RepID=A0ABM0ZYE7_APLCA|nr:DEP domain-containing protein 1A [Aplysia californica]
MESTTDAAIIGPYKATRLWNDVISAFRQYLPTGRHRRYMKTFENCFSGSSAADWLLQYLKTNECFGSDISRQKSLLLLNKLYKAGIFEEVKVSRNMRHKQDVQENRLYRFLPISPSKIKIPRLPLAPRNDTGMNLREVKSLPVKPLSNKPPADKQIGNEENPPKKTHNKLSRKISFKKDKVPLKEPDIVEEKESVPQCHLMKRILTTKEIKDTWKAVYLYRLRKSLSVTELGDILQTDLVDGYYVMHNCIYLNKSGVVTNIQPDDQLPHWVMSAMKCLARWPEPPEPGLPNYPGFEKDVFNVVRDYFLGLEEPLVPFVLYEVITNVFVMAGNHLAGTSGSPREDEETDCPVPSLWTSASLENIILNLTKKYCTLDSSDQRHSAFSLEDLQHSSNVHGLTFGNQEDLRFADHVDHTYRDYNLSAYPSTDGMDKLAQSRKKLNPFFSGLSFDLGTQESCPSLPTMSVVDGPRVLSRTTHSAGEVLPNGIGLLKKAGRRFDSTPNLKVSRYETAFGPDNKTVTRVYFQKGVSTERLDSQREEESSASQKETCFDAYLDDEALCPEVNLERGQSCECIAAISAGSPLDRNTLPRPSLGRSKSFADVKVTPSRGDRSVDAQAFIPPNGLPLKSRKDRNHSSSFYDSSDSICPNFRESSNQVSMGYGEAASFEQDQMNVASHCGKSRSFLEASERSGPSLTTRSNSFAVGDHTRGQKYSENTRRSGNRFSAYIDQPASSPLRDILEDVPSFGPGYRPVLDRSKEGRPSSMSDAYPLHQAPTRRHLPRSQFSAEDQVTSTPLDHYHLSNPAKRHGFTSSLENITPFFGTSQRHGNLTSGKAYLNFPQTRLSESRAKNSLQLITLLLPPANRRKLHMLFKMMVKMTANPNLCLDPTQTTRSLVLGTFYRAIVRPQDENNFDEFVVLQLVSFMLDFFDEIFAPPSEMKSQVSDRLKVLQRPQVVYSPRPVTRFCQQTSLADFENQSKSSSLSALEGLLERIVADKSMNLKEKRRRLKQFQRTYPTIYTRRFPTPELEAQVLPPRPKFKQPLLVKPLTKLKGLRL